MRSRVSVTGIIIRILMGLSLLLCLIGCGGSSDNKQRVTLFPTQATVNPSPPQEGLDIAGLHIDGGGVSCALGVINYGFFGSNLVLAKNHQSYDAGQIQQITNYVSTLIKQHGISSQSLPPLPDALRWLPGSPPHSTDTTCLMHLAITNTGEKAIQILSLHMRFPAAPQLNKAPYRLINACPLVPPSEKEDCPPPAGFGTALSYSFELKDAPTGTTFMGTARSNVASLSTQPTLQPGKVVVIDIFFGSTGSPDNFIYTVIPELMLTSTEGGTRMISLDQLKSQVYFADQKQFSCYTVEGNTFKLLTDLTIKGGQTWCI